MSEKIIPIKATRMGAVKRAIPISSTIKVEERWGRTHGEASISGFGKYLLIDISNLGNHRCCLIQRSHEGFEEILDSVSTAKFCHLCKQYRNYR